MLEDGLRVVLVGLGDIGLGAHLPALLRHGEVQVVGLVDVSAERRRAADPGPWRITGELDEVLGEADAVVLATPPWVTPDLTVRALQAGRYVLAEKPVATSTQAAEAYDVLSAEARRRLQIGLTYRHDPAIETLRDRMPELGRPLLVRAHIYDERRDPSDPAHGERIRATLEHGPPVVHEGAHVFDWLSSLLGGPPTHLDDAWALRTDPVLASPNLIGARLTYPGGTVALVEFGWFTDALPLGQVSLLGPRGHAVLDGRTFRLELSTVEGREVVEPAGDRMARCFDRQVERFVELVSGRRERPEPDLADGLAALAISEQISLAAKEVG